MVDQGQVNIMFAINKKEAPIGKQKLFKMQGNNTLQIFFSHAH